MPQIVSGLPSDGYGRGSTAPVLPNQPSLFFRAGTENICAAVAASVIDVAAAKQVAGVKYWSSAAPDAAIADFVATVMALVPSDPRAAPATTLLKDHFTGAMAQGASASDALQVDVRGGVPGAVRGLDRNLKESRHDDPPTSDHVDPVRKPATSGCARWRPACPRRSC